MSAKHKSSKTFDEHWVTTGSGAELHYCNGVNKTGIRYYKIYCAVSGTSVLEVYDDPLFDPKNYKKSLIEIFSRIFSIITPKKALRGDAIIWSRVFKSGTEMFLKDLKSNFGV